MALDLTKVATQVGEMLHRLKDRNDQRREHLLRAINALHQSNLNFDRLKKKIEDSKTTWLVAGLIEDMENASPPPPLPLEFTVIASDGSHIDVDRHHAARCYLINTGGVTLHYGAKPNAELESQPRLYDADEDLVVAPPDGKGREQMVEGGLLSIKRGVEECRCLADLAAVQPPGSSVTALLDGSLILWGLEAFPDFVTDILLFKGFLAQLDRMRKLNKDRTLAVASYISLPRSADVVNALRVSLCPHETVDSDRMCQDCGTRECEAVAGVLDRELFSHVLKPGERSAIFASQSSVVRKHYGENRVIFFYLRLEDEIARVEIPQWVARDKILLNLTHTMILDQCRRGHGYPVALSEAHEQAVITGIDREDFWQLVETIQAEDNLTAVTSAKSDSKRTRWV
jgi:hypothetical protein